MNKRLFLLKNSIKNIYRYRSRYLLFGFLYLIAVCAFSVLLNTFLYIDKSVESLKMQYFATVKITGGALHVPLEKVMREFDEENFFAYLKSPYVDNVTILSYRFSTTLTMPSLSIDGMVEPAIPKTTRVELSSGGAVTQLRGDALETNPVYAFGLNFEALKERGKITDNNFVIEKGRMYEGDDECVIAQSGRISDEAWNSLDIGDTVTIVSDSVMTDESLSKSYTVVGILQEDESLVFPDYHGRSPQTRILYTTLNGAVSLKDMVRGFSQYSPVANVSIDIFEILPEPGTGGTSRQLPGFEVWVDLKSYAYVNNFALDAKADDYMAQPLFPRDTYRPLWDSFEDSREWSLTYMYTIIFFVVGLTVILTVLLLNNRKYEIAVLRSVGMKKARMILSYLTENLAFLWGIAVVSLILAQAVYFLLFAQGVTGGVDAKFLPDSPWPVLLQNIGLTFGGITVVAVLSLIIVAFYIVRFEPLKIFNKQY